MSSPPITVSDVPAALAREIVLLDEVLAEVLVDVAGTGLLEQVNALRHGALAMQSDPVPERGDALSDLVAGWDEDTAYAVTRAFTLYFQLINLAEEHHRARLLRQMAADGAVVPDSLEAAVQAITGGEGRDLLEDLLGKLTVHPVLTAHPTEARRRAIVDSLHRVAAQLDRLDRTDLGASRASDIRRRLLEEVTVLWHTAPFRHERPTPVDEARRVMAVFDAGLFRVVPDVYRELDRSLAGERAGSRPPGFPPFLRWGSWVGGDRDGNPYVTAAVTREVLAIQSDHVLRGLEQATRRIARSFTVSDTIAGASEELRRSLLHDQLDFPEVAKRLLQTAPDQPHRWKLVLAAERLAATRAGDGRCYVRPSGFVEDIRVLQRSLEAAGLARLAFGELQHLLWQAESFGFHLASLEIRQHSGVHRQVIDELLPGVSADPAALERLATDGWSREIEPTSPLAVEVLSVFGTMRELQDRYGSEACFRYVVSFSQSAADLVAVRALARLALGPDPQFRLQVVPLFETRADLQRAPAVLEEYLSLPGEARVLDERGGTLEVMVGYSDSAKDVGVLAANLALHELQGKLAAWTRERGIEVTFFHGRGGSLGRGGGRVNRAIRGQAAGSVGGRFKVTEQGEVIFARYRNAELGRRHLEQVTNAVLLASTPAAEEANEKLTAEFADLRVTMARASEEAYKRLVDSDGFADFFAAVTPYVEIGQLRIGSRPAHRSQARDLSSLRAIPWVFSWSQNRVNLTGWFGVGTGLAAVVDDPSGLERLRHAYARWPFFNQLLENVEMSLLKAQPVIAERYLALGNREDLTALVSEELDRTRELVSAVTGHARPLDDNQPLQRVIDLRSHYVDALSFIQLHHLGRLRRGIEDPEQEARARKLVMLTVNGLAAGLQNTG